MHNKSRQTVYTPYIKFNKNQLRIVKQLRLPIKIQKAIFSNCYIPLVFLIQKNIYESLKKLSKNESF